MFLFDHLERDSQGLGIRESLFATRAIGQDPDSSPLRLLQKGLPFGFQFHCLADQQQCIKTHGQVDRFGVSRT